ncbi:hypothetical protein [Hyphomonas atlantica corrig.]|uniref:hypothetical protein n=1 Tax=Hyphomonas atlantica TaxID=1280948 RepID=UPI002354DFF9|nr:hypothetical protein [Hyphomonas atlantica]
MSRQRSPNYPNISLPEAISRAGRAYELDRDAPLDREVAAKHIGYSGRSGTSDKTIGSITQYGLFEPVGKGEVRVSRLALDILHPLDESKKREALQRAAYMPSAFQLLRSRFGAGVVPSEDAATAYLIRENFLPHAIERIYSSYDATCQFLKQEGANEFTVPSEEIVEESPAPGAAAQPSVGSDEARSRPASRAPYRSTEATGMQRMLTQGMLSKGATFEIIVTGQIGPKEIDTLIRKLEIDKAILADDDKIDGEADE